MTAARGIFVLIALVCVVVAVAPATAQIPDTFTNLQVLPGDTPKGELIGVMRAFSGALGVRCIHCHVGEDPHDLSTVDFASDAKDTKKIAREMMKMSHEVNSILAKSISSMRPEPLHVRCVTCHHGVPRPETLEQVLAGSLAISGADSTVARYHRLRKQFYGTGAYDFSEWSLISAAESIARDPAAADAALALLAANLEYYPESAGTYARIAETHLIKGDRESALKHFDKAQSLAPDDPWLKRRIERVKAGQ